VTQELELRFELEQGFERGIGKAIGEAYKHHVSMRENENRNFREEVDSKITDCKAEYIV
jgi:hypothetical protein